MGVGLMVQASVMITNAIVVYRWRWLRVKSIVAPYGYPTWAAGIVAIALGVTLCGRVVESSTSEYVLLPEKNFGPGHLRIIRLQRGNPESKIPAYSINNAEKNSRINISKRTFSPALEEDGMAALASQKKNEGRPNQACTHCLWVYIDLSRLHLPEHRDKRASLVRWSSATRSHYYSCHASRLVAAPCE
jgi:hypothetical protein